MPISPEAAHYRAIIAGRKRAIRNGECPPDDPSLGKAQKALRDVLLCERAERIVADWEPLSDEAQQRIAAILLAGGGGHAA